MTSKQAVDDFLAQKTIALVGLSRSGTKFSRQAYKELKAKGYTLLPVNPSTDTIDGERCYHNLAEIPSPPDAALIMTPSSATESAVRDAIDAGIRRVWIQQGSESEAATKLCHDNDLVAVEGECVMMFAEPAAFHHRLHRFVWKLLGKLPQ